MIRRLVLLLLLAVPSLATAQVYGPQASITCPVGAVDIWPGVDINLVVVANPSNTAFCLRAGVHPITYATVPRSGDTFTGEYSAVLDGSNWSTTDPSQGAFRALNVDVNTVTIRNLVIRNMQQYGVYTFSSGVCDATHCTLSTAGADGWTVENNEISGNRNGLHVSNGMQVLNNYIHHNTSPDACQVGVRSGGVYSYANVDVVYENNEVAYNGCEQKFAQMSMRTTVRGNFVHHNQGNGIWADGENPNTLIETNRVEDNAGQGIFFEASGKGIIRNNVIKRSGGNGIFIATSHSVDIAGNTLEDNYRGINYFVDCAILYASYGGSLGEDFYLQDVASHDNRIVITPAAKAGSWTGVLDSANCTATQLAGYMGGQFNLTFTHNSYQVPDVNGAYWLWGNAFRTWSQWQGLPQDVTGTLNAGTTPTPTTEPPSPAPDTLAPTVTLKATRSGKSTNYSVTTTATDNVRVTWFALSIDGQVFANQPGSYTVKITAAGVHTFKAEAKDGAGNVAFTTATVTR